MPKRYAWTALMILLFVLAMGLAFAVDMYFDFLWFKELGKTPIFTTSLYAKGVIGSGVLCVVFLFFYLNLMFAENAPGLIQIGIPTPTGQITAYTFPRDFLRRLLGMASGVLGLFFAARSAENWEIIWQWMNRVEFGTVDPIFSKDISFYFFVLPVMEELVRVGLLMCVLTGVASLVLYYFKGVLSFKPSSGRGPQGRIRTHVSLLAFVFFLFLAADAWLDRFQILFANHGPMYGATYSDLHARLPLLGFLAICSAVGAALLLFNAFARNNRAAVVCILVYGAALAATNIYPALLQKFVVAPNELGKEAPQIQHNIDATLRAYKLDSVQDRDLSGDKALTPDDIKANAATIHSIRLWDHQPLLDAFSQIQEIRTYYDFVSVDNDRYLINGEHQQIMLSARELNGANLPERNWINEHLSYTHGYGLTLGPVNRVTSEGLPVLMVQDIPPRTTDPVFRIDRPEIYFGEQTKGYVAVKTGAKEFDYPAGEENVYTSYQGTGGVPVESFLRKLLFAVYFKDPNVVLSPLVKAESRFLYFRDIKTRLNRVAPFLMLDQDPYLVIHDGRLFWIQDAYTSGWRYPYSTPVRGIGNYMRNSVKMILDAYNGTVDLYVTDPEDPLIRVYQRIFPGVFRPDSDIPSGLRSHLRYPEDIFKVQTSIYSVYHMTHPQTFYNKEDLWEIPALGATGNESIMSPYYTIMRLPQEQQEEFILMLPFTPGRKDNLSAWMVARSDGERYGQLVVYRFPKKKLVYGPKQIAARINQDAEISKLLSLWDQRGSQVIQGTLLVIPVEEALLYIRPLYLRAESGKIPELKRVIVAYENKIAMEETLEGSLARIFQFDVPQASVPGISQAAVATGKNQPAQPFETKDLARQAREAYDRAINAQKQGDWAKYGEEIRRLGSILEEMKKIQ